MNETTRWFDNLLVKYLEWKGWFIVKPDRLQLEDECTADARGYLTGYPQLGRVGKPFDDVEIYSVIKTKKEDDNEHTAT